MSESNRKFCETVLSTPYQTAAITPIAIVETCGVRYRGWTRPSGSGNAPWRAMDSDVRDAGRIVVCVEASADVTIASTTIQLSSVPSTSSAIAPKMPGSSTNSFTRSSPANATTAVVTAT